MAHSPLAISLKAAILATGLVLFPVHAAHAQLFATRQVSTGDISPTLYAQVNNGGPFEAMGSIQFFNRQLFTPAVDGESLAFTTSSQTPPGFNPLTTGLYYSGLYVIDGLVPQLYTDGTSNLNVKPIAQGVSDPAVGVFDNGPGDANSPVGFDFRPTGISLSGGSVSVLTMQEGASGLGLYEGTTTTTTTAPVPAMGVIADQNTPVLSGATVLQGAITTGVTNVTDSFARDGDRTVTVAGMEDGRMVVMSHENGVRENLLVSGGGAAGIDLPDAPFGSSKYVDAEGGEFVLIANNSRVYKFDAANNASLLLNSGPQHLDYLAFDGQDVVVGQTRFVTGIFNPKITTRTRGSLILGDQPFLGERLGAISRVENGALVDLVNNESTHFPDGGPAFSAFGPFSYSDGNLAFLGSSTDRGGLFVLYQGVVHKVLEFGDTFDGKTVEAVDVHRAGLDSDVLAFVVTFGITNLPNGFIDYDQNIYTMSLSENFALDGDFDFDGDVDGNDFLVWQRGGSPNGTGSGDLALWQDNFGTPLVAVSAVPEPSSLVLLGMGGLLLLRRIR